MADTQPSEVRIRAANPSLEGYARTFLTSDIAASAVLLSTLDNAGFTITGTTDYYVLLEEFGFEKAEAVLVDANGGGTSTTGFTIAATKYSHEAATPVTYLPYNKIQIFGATSSGGTKVLITTIDIAFSQQYTEYIYTGTTYSYFYIAYYNSYAETLSAYSDEITSTSYTRRSVKRIIESGLRKALTKIDNSANSVLNWDIALEILQDGIDEILAKKRKWPFLRTIKADTTTTANTQYIEKPSDLSMLEFLIIDKNQQEPISRIDYNAYTAIGEDGSKGRPFKFTEKNNKYYLTPTPDAAYNIIYEYYKVPAVITSNLATEIDLPFVPVLIYYCAAHFAYIRGNDKRGDKMYGMFLTLLNDQIVEYSGPEQSGQAEYADQTSIYGDTNEDNYYLI